MKILLFNDNPVVRKLVALSAQKTKDELSVIGSLDEIEESGFDLLIIDDALYSDEIFESLKEAITFKSTLLMATRGKAVPAGFAYVINKPFLPTDLVDMFVQIDKKIASLPQPSEAINLEELPRDKKPAYAIDLEESLPDLDHDIGDKFESFELDGFDEIDLDDDLTLDDTSMGDFGSTEFDESIPETAILDKEEVQEVQGLLNDTDEDEWKEEEITVKGIDELDEFDLKEDVTEGFDGLEETSAKGIDTLDEFDLDEDELEGFDPLEETASPMDDMEEEFGEIKLADTFADESDMDKNLLEEDTLDLDDELAMMSGFQEESTLNDGLDEDLLAKEDEAEDSFAHEDLLLDDEGLDDLELEIQNAVSGLEAETLDQELEAEDLEMDFEDALLESEEELSYPESSLGASKEIDELDLLNERDLMIAIGEEIDDEALNLSIDHATNEISEQSEVISHEDDKGTAEGSNNHVEGVEALQTLLKALANEEVVKSLKGLNISININFGNDK
ncbi:MAG: hypothetical protein PHW64_06925 [Sulfuricurvum sp.]|nr:hypothetical protein [Sulfuricurvum sp.]